MEDRDGAKMASRGPTVHPWDQLATPTCLWTEQQCPSSLLLPAPPLGWRVELATVKSASFPASWALMSLY